MSVAAGADSIFHEGVMVINQTVGYQYFVSGVNSADCHLQMQCPN